MHTKNTPPFNNLGIIFQNMRILVILLNLLTKNNHFSQVCHAICTVKTLRFINQLIALYVIKNIYILAVCLESTGAKTKKYINILMYEYIYMNYLNFKVAYFL
ncbi:hypothetical protein L323_15115 [Ruminiclostridium papyrosolvens C7]|uniref:Uncharacterized protein n=1 Tax=Ruminiclostridium papyrosolvens C7 TaxID=1330534 RepID=U4QZZ4_9FIRM|nr:hypothetical protein L323_15115 [Ruminiclostridium papyrosolvens C7]